MISSRLSIVVLGMVFFSFGFTACSSNHSPNDASNNNHSVELNQLQARYDRLKLEHDKARRSGLDLRQIEPLLQQVKEAKIRKEWTQLDSLLSHLESSLAQLAPATLDEGRSHGSSSSDDERLAPASEGLDTRLLTGGVGDNASEKALLAHLQVNTQFKKLLVAKGTAHSIGPSGAIGRNVKQYQHIGEQRAGLWLVRKGILLQEVALIEKGIQAFEYGFTKQERQGNFANSLSYSAEKGVGADAFFLKAFGQCYWLIYKSQYRSEFLPKLNRYKKSLELALAWLEKNKKELYRQDKHAPNRLAFDGLAFLLNGKILNNPRYIGLGEKFLTLAMNTQQDNGVFLEHGGYDSSYQAVNILNLMLAYMNIGDSPSLKNKLYTAVQKGVEWELSKIKSDGEVSVEGNTRTGKKQEKLFGKYKEVNYAEVALALYYWGGISGDVQSIIKADRVVAYLEKKYM